MREVILPVICVDVAASKGLLAEFRGDAVAVGIFENEVKGKPPSLHIAAQRIDAKAGRILSDSVKAGEFTGKLNSVAVYHVKGIPSRLVLFVGLGKKSGFEPDIVRQAAGKACCAARDLGAKSLGFCADSAVEKGVSLEKAGRLLTEGAILGLYTFDAYKTEKSGKELKSLTLLTSGDAKAVARGAVKGEAVASSTNITREICNDPGNYAHPSKVAALALGLAKKFGFKCKVLEKKEIEKEGMNGLLSVASGSCQPPMFAVLEYSGAGKGQKPIVLIGKGITFDSGGISIKPANDMEKMKFDKAGACAILGVFVAAARMKVKRNIVGLMPLTENLPSGTAARPGDVVRMRSGKTAEIISTDAEGRMILADALDYAKEFKPSAIVDLATLTGAVVVALGYEASGVMGNDEKLLSKVEKAGDESGERVWRLPMWKAYDDYNKSEVADVRNVGPSSRAAGTICAGKFLEVFVPEGVPWVHVDIAATAWNEKPKPYGALGATGVGVRLLSALLEEL